jgi:hypothetical protein
MGWDGGVLHRIVAHRTASHRVLIRLGGSEKGVGIVDVVLVGIITI